ncbi:MAG TPA: radical SAM protein [Bacteroidia bacterium]|nr:radical SAM protein [Bacteroidia bacterium]
MTKVLFTHSYFLRFDPKQWKQQQPYPPLGTMYAAAVLRQAGYDVSLADSMFFQSPEEIITALDKDKPEVLVIYDDGFNYLTKMCLTNMREAAFRMIQLAKERDCKIIVSGSDATDHCDEYLTKGADYVVLGEGEVALQQLVDCLPRKETNANDIAGLAFKNGNEVIKTAKREVLRELDTLPMPAWDLIDIQPYKDAWLNNWRYFSMNVATTRGCPFKCNWCAKPIYGNRYNSRSPEKVAEEIEYLIKQFGAQHIWFCDDIFGLKPGWVNRFADIVEEKKLDFKFKIQSRADLLVEEGYVTALAGAGCESAWMGAESGSQKILDAMDKGIKVEQVYEATRLLKKHSIRPAFFLQFGYPGEELGDIQMTIKMLLDLMPADIGVSVSYPLPGTKFYGKVKDDLKKKTNWKDSDELALMFRNTYPPQFYKELHRFIHKIYKDKQAANSIRQIISKPFDSNREEFTSALSMLYYKPALYLYRMRMKKYEKANV